MVEFPKIPKYPVLPQKGGKMAVRLPPGEGKKKTQEKPQPPKRTGQYQAQPPGNQPPPTATPGGGLKNILTKFLNVIMIIVVIAIIGIAISVWVESGTAGRMWGYLQDFLGGSSDGGGGGGNCECTCPNGNVCTENSDCGYDAYGIPEVCGCPVGC